MLFSNLGLLFFHARSLRLTGSCLISVRNPEILSIHLFLTSRFLQSLPHSYNFASVSVLLLVASNRTTDFHHLIIIHVGRTKKTATCYLPLRFINYLKLLNHPRSSPLVAITFLYQSNDFFFERRNVPLPASSRST